MNMVKVWRDGEVIEVEEASLELPTENLDLIPQSATKLGLKRALSEIGRWAEVRSLIDGSPEIAEDWLLAVEIKRDDPLFQQFITSGQFSVEEVDEVFRRAVEVVSLV